MMQFAQQMYHNYLAVYDNVKHIPKWFCDELCKATTGIGISKRTLFSDDDDTIYQYKRCIVINGINNVVVEPDALDRSIQMEHKRIKDENAKEDAEIKARFEELRPKLFAYILDIVVKALDNKSKLSKITGGSMRMADSVYWGEAISRAMGEKPLAFANAYWENTGKQSANIIENHNLAQAIIRFVDTQCTPKDGDNNLLWVGKAADLLNDLTSIATQNKLYDESTKKYWPKRVENLTKRLRPIIPNLKTAFGISIDLSTKIGTGRDKNLSYIEIRNEGHIFPEVLKSPLPALPALPSTKIQENTQNEKQENDSNCQKKAELCLGSQRKAESEIKAVQPYQNKTALPESPEIRAQIDKSKASKASKANLQIGGRTTPSDCNSTDCEEGGGSGGNMASLVSPVLQEVSTVAPTVGGVMESFATFNTTNRADTFTDSTNSDLEILPAVFQKPHAAFDLEWETKATAPNSRKRVTAFAIKDSLGQTFAHVIEDFMNGDIDAAECALLGYFMDILYEPSEEVCPRYPLTFGYYSTMTEDKNTKRKVDSDLVTLHKALDAHGLPRW
jgi:hypothetical protein